MLWRCDGESPDLTAKFGQNLEDIDEVAGWALIGDHDPDGERQRLCSSKPRHSNVVVMRSIAGGELKMVPEVCDAHCCGTPRFGNLDNPCK